VQRRKRLIIRPRKRSQDGYWFAPFTKITTLWHRDTAIFMLACKNCSFCDWDPWTAGPDPGYARAWLRQYKKTPSRRISVSASAGRGLGDLL